MKILTKMESRSKTLFYGFISAGDLQVASTQQIMDAVLKKAQEYPDSSGKFATDVVYVWIYWNLKEGFDKVPDLTKDISDKGLWLNLEGKGYNPLSVLREKCETESGGGF